MRKRAKVTSKGRVTIPREIRRTLGVSVGDHVVFEEDHNGVTVKGGA
jgi:AbrB family looped-hinge helix DNA binding protein